MSNIKNLSDDILRAENPAERAVKGGTTIEPCPKCSISLGAGLKYCGYCGLLLDVKAPIKAKGE